MKLRTLARIELNNNNNNNKSNFPLDAIDALKDAEALAIEACDKDMSGCLTWDEVVECVDKYGQFLPNFDIPLPTEEDFNKMAGDDGCLTFDEWEEYADLIGDSAIETTEEEGQEEN